MSIKKMGERGKVLDRREGELEYYDWGNARSAAQSVPVFDSSKNDISY